MSVNYGYYNSEKEFDEADKNGNNVDVTVTADETGQRSYTYDEALDIAGTGWYSWYLMLTITMSLLSAAVEMFAYSVIVVGSQCEFELELHHKTALLSMPFLGPIVMSYMWGYLSDTRGRRRCLLWAMSTGCAVSLLGAFSPNYIVSGFLKFISTSLCSCAQSTSYVLFGESSSTKARAPMLMLSTGLFNFTILVFIVPAYYILNLDFVITLKAFNILPWRILAMVLALPLAISTVMLIFVHESPKFVVIMQRHEEALEILRKIWKKNGNHGEYPVKSFIIKKEDDISQKSLPLLKSLWQQTVPLFKPPLLWRTLQLFYLISIIYSVNNSFGIWFTFISEAFFDGLKLSSNSDVNAGLCAVINQPNNVNETTPVNVSCSSKLEVNTVYITTVFAFTMFFLSVCISAISSRKKATILGLFTVTSMCALGANLVPHKITNLVMFMLIMASNLIMGSLFCYYVELYPTTYRGMVSSLGIIVARCSALAGVNLIGGTMMTHCSMTIYICSAYLLSGALVSLLLPPDNPVKSEQ